MSSVLDSNENTKGISLSRIRVHSPNIVQDSLVSARSLTTQLASISPMSSAQNSRKPSLVASNASSTNHNQTIDRFEAPSSTDEADPDELMAQDAIAEFYEYPDNSTAAIKSPLTQHHFRSGSVSMPVPSATASLATSSLNQDASTRATKSIRGSVSTTGSFSISKTVPPASTSNHRKLSIASAVSTSSPEGFPASEATATHAGGDSPTLGRFPMPPSYKPKKTAARDSMLLNRYPNTFENFTKAAKSPPQSPNPTLNTTSTTTRAERGLSIPFLPKFLKLAGNPRQSISSEPSPPIAAAEPGVTLEESIVDPEPTEVDEVPAGRERAQTLQSVFESESSSENSEHDDVSEDRSEQRQEEAFIGGAKLAARRRPKLVEHRSSSYIEKQRVSLKDILAEGGVSALHDRLHPAGTSVLADVNPGPSRLKAKKVLGDNSIKLKRAGIVGMPAVHETTKHMHAEQAGAEKMANREEIEEEWTDGLRSHPPAKRERRVTLPLEIRDGAARIKESIVSTPYPLGYKGKRSGEVEKRAKNERQEVGEGQLWYCTVTVAPHL